MSSHTGAATQAITSILPMSSHTSATTQGIASMSSHTSATTQGITSIIPTPRDDLQSTAMFDIPQMRGKAIIAYDQCSGRFTDAFTLYLSSHPDSVIQISDLASSSADRQQRRETGEYAIKGASPSRINPIIRDIGDGVKLVMVRRDFVGESYLFADTLEILNHFISRIMETYSRHESGRIHLSLLSPDCNGNYHAFSLGSCMSAQLTSPDLFFGRKREAIDLAVNIVKGDVSERTKRLGIPFRCNFLFYGPPGSGKTHLSYAIASALGRRVYKVMGIADMGSLFSTCENDSVIVFEDIDCLTISRENGEPFDPKKHLPLSLLLNGLEYGSEKGYVFIITTNYIEKLDPALIRSDRVTMAVEFSEPTEEERNAVIDVYFPPDEDVELNRGFKEVARTHHLQYSDLVNWLKIQANSPHPSPRTL